MHARCCVKVSQILFLSSCQPTSMQANAKLSVYNKAMTRSITLGQNFSPRKAPKHMKRTPMIGLITSARFGITTLQATDWGQSDLLSLAGETSKKTRDLHWNWKPEPAEPPSWGPHAEAERPESTCQEFHTETEKTFPPEELPGTPNRRAEQLDLFHT